MAFIKNYWFGLLVAIPVAIYIIVFFLVLASPKQDTLKRGFIPCTEKMAAALIDCRKEKFCLLKEVIANSWCNIRIVGRGINLWLQGRQPTPWANYMFEPETSAPPEKMPPELADFYQKDGDIAKNMLNLKQKNRELEKEVLKNGKAE